MSRTYITYLHYTWKQGWGGGIKRNDLFFFFYGSNCVQFRDIFVVSPPPHRTHMYIGFS